MVSSTPTVGVCNPEGGADKVPLPLTHTVGERDWVGQSEDVAEAHRVGLLKEAVPLIVVEVLGVIALLPLLHWVEEVVGVIVPLVEEQCEVDIVPVVQGETVGVVLVEAHLLPLPLFEPLLEV